MDEQLSNGELLLTPLDDSRPRSAGGTAILIVTVTVLQYVVILILAAVAALYYMVTVTTVDGESMENTLHNGQYVALQRHMYDINYGDIVTFNVGDAEDHYLIKRVIALDGDKVLFVRQSNNVYVDLYVCRKGSNTFKRVEEDYIKENMTVAATYEKIPPIPYIEEKTLNKLDITVENADIVTEALRQRILKNAFTVQKNHFFFLGDNRNHSNDSRHYGDMPLSSVYGKKIADLDGSGAFDGLIKFAFGL